MFALRRKITTFPSGGPSPAGPDGKRCYAIGDVHGRLDLLEELLERIREHDLSRPRRETSLVFLGDLIDRGPHSREVLQRVMRPGDIGMKVYCLRGNHEDLLLRALSGSPGQIKAWLQTGGHACAKSYGVDIGAMIGQPEEAIEHALSCSVPAEHIRFLERLPDSIRFGDYLLVHAGVRPGVPFEDQTPEDLRWIRQPFLDSTVHHGLMIVHGHSVSVDVVERANRICIDTGAWRTGVLTAIWIEGSERGFIQARGDTGPDR